MMVSNLAELAALRQAIQALYNSSDSVLQRQADQWLQGFRAQPGAWRACLQLLATGVLLDYEQYFLAHSFRTACHKMPEIQESTTLLEVIGQTSQLLKTSVAAQSWAVTGQLSAAFALVAVRAPSWDASCLVLDICNVLLPGLLAAAGIANPGLPANEGGQMLTPYQVIVGDAVAAVALLQVLAALPDACNSRNTTLHPARRAAVTRALVETPHLLVPLSACLSLPPALHQLCWPLVLRCLSGWCELGGAPAQLETNDQLIEHICQAVFDTSTCTAAADCLTSLFHTCSSSPQPTASTSPQGASPTHSMSSVPTGSAVAAGGLDPPTTGSLQAAKVPLFMALLRRWAAVLSPYITKSGTADEGAVGVSLNSAAALPLQQLQPEVKLAATSVCTSAAGAMLQDVLLGAPQLLNMFQTFCELLIALLGDGNDQVSLNALEFWQGNYVPVLQQRQQQAGSHSALQPHHPLLERLTTTLVGRTVLQPDVAAAATADGRDLPEEVRLVRRELAGALRDISQLVGPDNLLQFISRLVTLRWQQFKQIADSSAAGSSTGSMPDCKYEGWVQLECALYAANVVLGRCDASCDSPCIKQIVDAASSSLAHPATTPKLAGTCLTLLGGIAWWYCLHAEELAAVLWAILAAVRSSDVKLARNGATAVRRLCQNAQLAGLVMSQHLQWAQKLTETVPVTGPPQTPQDHPEDLTSEQLLITSLCHLAAFESSVTSSQAMDTGRERSQLETDARASLLQQLIQPRAKEAETKLQRLQSLSTVQQQHTVMTDIGHAFAGIARVLSSLPISQQPATGGAAAAGAHDQQAVTGAVQGRGSGGSAMSQDVSSRNSSQGGAVGEAAAQQQVLREQAVQILNTCWPAIQLAVQPAIVQHASLHHLVASAASLMEGLATACASQLNMLLPRMAQLLSPLPHHLLASKAVLNLLGTIVSLAASSSSSSNADSGHARHSGGHLHPHHATSLLQSNPQLASQLTNIMSLALQAACHAVSSHPGMLMGAASSVQKQVQPDLLALLRLATVCAQCMLQPLIAESVLQPLMGITAAACHSDDYDQCQVVLKWISALCAAPYTGMDAVPAEMLTTATRPVPAAYYQPQAATIITPTGGYVQQGPSITPQLSTVYLPPASTVLTHSTAAVYMPHSGTLMLPPTAGPRILDVPVGGMTMRPAPVSHMAVVHAYPPQHMSHAMAVPAYQQVYQQMAPMHVQLGHHQTVTLAASMQAQPPPIPSQATATALHTPKTVLAAMFEDGRGAQLMLMLMLAASGNMPPGLMMPIATCMHSVWQAAGQLRFLRWLQTAVQVLAPASAPWARLRREAKAAFFQELTARECERDVGKFKRVLKAFCGGKKKGTGPAWGYR